MTPAARQSARAPRESRLVRVVERVAIGIASLALSIGLIMLLSGYFAGRDQAGGVGRSSGPGQAFRDLGHAALRPGQPHPSYNSNPPTSGAHVPEAVTSDDATLNDDQLLEALQVGERRDRVRHPAAAGRADRGSRARWRRRSRPRSRPAATR